MSSHDNDNGGDGYKVGPKCPPKEHQWKKGCPFPNPAGRPRKDKSNLFAQIDPFAAAVVKFDNATLSCETGDGVVDLTKREAALQKLFKNAMTTIKNQGATPTALKALKMYFDIVEKAQAAQAEVKQDMLMAAVMHIEKWLHVFENCEAMGHPLPIVYPDPRDIEIKEDGTVHIDGPTDRLAHQQMKELIEKRDGLLSMLAVYDRLNLSGDLARERRFAKFRREARRINKALPLRLQVYVDAREDASEASE